MITAGIDIGSRAAKAVIMENDKILSYSVCETGPESAKTALMAINEAMKGRDFSLNDIQYIVATGYGRFSVPFGNENISEISCHARGAQWHFPSVRTILDMGGQDCKGINCNGKGQVTKFMMNDRCAGGTGRFLEVIASALQIPLDQVGELSLQSKQHISFNAQCTVFAKSEALTLLKKGVSKSDILAGLHDAIAMRTFNLLRRISIEKDFVVTGGIAKNIGMLTKLKEKVKLEPLIAPEPLIIGAIGAALFAQERFLAKEKAD